MCTRGDPSGFAKNILNPTVYIHIYVTDCIEVDIDYYGSDLSHSIEDSWQSCAESCLEDDHCRYWTFTGRCFRKSTASGRRPKTDAISGSQFCVHP